METLIECKDPNTGQTKFIFQSTNALGQPEYQVREANGGIRRFGTLKEAQAYTPNTTDPADNAANWLIADVLMGPYSIGNNIKFSTAAALIKKGRNLFSSEGRAILANEMKKNLIEATINATPSNTSVGKIGGIILNSNYNNSSLSGIDKLIRAMNSQSIAQPIRQRITFDEKSGFILNTRGDFINSQRDFNPSLIKSEIILDPNISKAEYDFVNAQKKRGAQFFVSPQEAEASSILEELSKMTGKEQQNFFINNIDRSMWLQNQRTQNGGFERMLDNYNKGMQKLKTIDPNIEAVLKKYHLSLTDPKFYDIEGAGNYDVVKFWQSLSNPEQLSLDKYLEEVSKGSLPWIPSAINDETIIRQTRLPWVVPDEESLQVIGYQFPYQQFSYDPKSNDIITDLDKGHESVHGIVPIIKPFPVEDFKNTMLGSYLFNQSYGTESAARGSQILNALGITDGTRLINPIELNWMTNVYPYIKYPNINNNMITWGNVIFGRDPYLRFDPQEEKIDNAIKTIEWLNKFRYKKGGKINGKRKYNERN